MGRWTQRDPAGYVDGVGLYEYVSSRSVAGSDPLGLLSIGAAGGASRSVRVSVNQPTWSLPPSACGARLTAGGCRACCFENYGENSWDLSWFNACMQGCKSHLADAPLQGPTVIVPPEEPIDDEYGPPSTCGRLRNYSGCLRRNHNREDCVSCVSANFANNEYVIRCNRRQAEARCAALPNRDQREQCNALAHNQQSNELNLEVALFNDAIIECGR
jgi:hypothetical protein